MPDHRERCIIQCLLTIVTIHVRELALIPALRDSSGHVEIVAVGNEQVLAVLNTSWDVVCEIASFCSNFRVCSAVTAPSHLARPVISAPRVVMVQDGILIVGRVWCQFSLTGSRDMLGTDRSRL